MLREERAAGNIVFPADSGVVDVTKPPYNAKGDGQGVVGLDMGYTDEQGPCLVKRLRVLGFDVGVRCATSVASETLEHITVEHQNVAGFRNEGQPCTVLGLKSLNEVPPSLPRAGSTWSSTANGGAPARPPPPPPP